MAKMNMLNNRVVLKVKSSLLKKNNWNLILTDKLIKRENMETMLASSQLIRFIDMINGISRESKENEINNLKAEIKSLNQEKNLKSNRELLKEKRQQLKEAQSVKDLISIEFESKADFNCARSAKTHVTINGIEFVRLLGTTGGVKKNTVFFVNEEIHEELNNKINNGVSKGFKIVPAKMEAYRALSASSSTPVRMPRIMVIKDAEVKIKENVQVLSGRVWKDLDRKNYLYSKKVKELTDEEKAEKKMIEDYENQFDLNDVDDYEIVKNPCDGSCMVSPEFAKLLGEDLGLDYIPGGFNTRFAYVKGMIYTFDFVQFAEEVNGASSDNEEKYLVEDFWGNKQDVRNIDVILTENQFKLAKAYDSVEQYLEECSKNGWEFSISKVLPKKLEKTRNMNYQFLQSYDLTDEDIKNLLRDEIDYLKGVIYNSYEESILFLKGNVPIDERTLRKEDATYVKALMINRKMHDDMYIRNKITNLLRKRINDAKKGSVIVRGNYQLISGDLYGLCQSMFGLEITGILGKDEYYSNEWISQGVEEVVSFRAPMSIHSNICKMKMTKSEEAKKWFKYMTTAFVINMWGTDMERLNGADYDGDAVISTNNEVLLNKWRNEKCVVCEQTAIAKTTINEARLAHANLNGFGNNVGSITNVCTSMYDVLARCEKGSKEYNEMIYRITSMQGYQQDCIDSVKGIKARQVPKHWKDLEACSELQCTNEEREFNKRICANKKPYFFQYNYPEIKRDCKKEEEKKTIRCWLEQLMSPQDFKAKENKTPEEELYLKELEEVPVSKAESIMNKICWYLEKETKKIKLESKNCQFDNSILMSDTQVSPKTKKEVIDTFNTLKKEYIKINSQYTKEDKENKLKLRVAFMENLKAELEETCSNIDMIVNTLVEHCYKKNDSNISLIYELYGNTLINNLLKNSNYEINTFRACEENEEPTFTFLHNNYICETVTIDKEYNRIEK